MEANVTRPIVRAERVHRGRVWCVEREVAHDEWEPVVMCPSYPDACEEKRDRVGTGRLRIKEWVRAT